MYSLDGIVSGKSTTNINAINKSPMIKNFNAKNWLSIYMVFLKFKCGIKSKAKSLVLIHNKRIYHSCN